MMTALVGVLMLSAALIVAGAVPAAHAQPDEPLEYVAMGDSFAAAAGVTPAASGSAMCMRSLRNYAQLVAAAQGARLTDVSCAGADTEDFAHSQGDGVAPQLAALGASTDLVTFSIGGNDNGVFAGTIADCIVAGAGGSIPGTPCADRHLRATVQEIRTRTYPNLVRAMTAVREKAPNARVFALNYLWLVPDRATSCAGVPIAPGDMRTARRVQTEVSDAIERAAQRTGVTFVDVADPAPGRDACGPRGVRYVEPLIGGAHPVGLHPNARGERHMARVVERAVAGR